MDGADKVDPALASFIQEESHRQKFTATVHALNDVRGFYDFSLGTRTGEMFLL
jgi:hypothetical protein